MDAHSIELAHPRGWEQRHVEQMRTFPGAVGAEGREPRGEGRFAKLAVFFHNHEDAVRFLDAFLKADQPDDES